MRIYAGNSVRAGHHVCAGGGVMNTWPGGQRKALSQNEHAAWNAITSPGTLQLCDTCGDTTGRCEEDAIYLDSGDGPLCQECFHNSDEFKEQS